MTSRRTVVAVTAVAACSLAAGGLALAACDRRPTIVSCGDNLHGVWVAPGDARWALVDHGSRLDAFPLFDDAVPAGAPRVIELARSAAPGAARDGSLAGEARRRFMRGGDACEARAQFRITRCSDRELEVVGADPQPPLGYAPCSWGAAPDTRVERWRRE